MKNKVYSSFDEAVAGIPDGATIMFPGFGPPGIPRNLIAALIRQGAKDLIGICNNHGALGNLMDVGRLIETERVVKWVCAFTAAPHPSRKLAFEGLYEEGKIEAELVPQGTLAERIRAGGAGIGAFYTPTGVGTEVAEGKEHREIDGRMHILEYPLKADYALIRARRADKMGNLQYRLSQRNFNPLMAQAATTTIVEVEEDILEPGQIDPDQVHTPCIFVDRMVRIPPAPEGIWDAPTRT
ncbi:MAG: 3-oxoacid CoA-transferase subunit A [Dehalococcoidia bacterium]|nr:3-oxoacid CoA-transferase subunit A [Dehalococcoidia bacterium]